MALGGVALFADLGGAFDRYLNFPWPPKVGQRTNFSAWWGQKTSDDVQELLLLTGGGIDA